MQRQSCVFSKNVVKKTAKGIIAVWIGLSVAFAAEGYELLLSQPQPTVGDRLDYSLKGAGARPDLIIRDQGSVESGFFIRSGKLIFIRSGEITVPSLKVFAGEEEVGSTDPLVQAVKGVLPPQGQGTEEQKPTPPIDPKSVGLPIWVKVFIGLLSVLLLAAIVRWARKRWLKKQEPVAPVMIPPTPFEVAVQSLDALKRELEQGNPKSWKKFYFKISDTLKAYFSDQLLCDARESTTSEMLDILKKKQGEPGISEDWVRSVKSCFEILDLVKFTNFEPDVSESRTILTRSREIVNEVKR